MLGIESEETTVVAPTVGTAAALAGTPITTTFCGAVTTFRFRIASTVTAD